MTASHVSLSLFFSLSLLHRMLTCVSLLSLHLFLFLIHCLCTFTSERVLVRAHVDGPGPPTDTVDHTLCHPCPRAHLDLLTTACVSSPKKLGCLQWLVPAAGCGQPFALLRLVRRANCRTAVDVVSIHTVVTLATTLPTPNATHNVSFDVLSFSTEELHPALH